MERIGRIAGHVTSARPAVADDVVICCAVRTPICKAGKGGLAEVHPEEMLKPLFAEVLKRTGLQPTLIQDICIGNVLQPGAGCMTSRLAQLLGGVPPEVPLSTVNRMCSSGLQAVANIAGAIRAGFIDIGLAGGVESMTRNSMASIMEGGGVSEEVFDTPDQRVRDCLLPMGITSENVAREFGIDRATQDQLAVESHAKAAAAQQNGLYDEEIVPVVRADKKVISKDDGIRKGTTMETLAKLRPAFDKKGTTTAGNSSQVSDGAALVLLARRSRAEALGLPVLARIRSFAVVGVPPAIMGIGPAVAIPEALKQAGLRIEDIDVFEVNEAFASQASYCVKKLGIHRAKLNPKGGAIALGHPLGATGSRQIATLLPELRRTRGRYGVVSMCIGTGMGAAAVIENLA